MNTPRRLWISTIKALTSQISWQMNGISEKANVCWCTLKFVRIYSHTSSHDTLKLGMRNETGLTASFERKSLLSNDIDILCVQFTAELNLAEEGVVMKYIEASEFRSGNSKTYGVQGRCTKLESNFICRVTTKHSVL